MRNDERGRGLKVVAIVIRTRYTSQSHHKETYYIDVTFAYVSIRTTGQGRPHKSGANTTLDDTQTHFIHWLCKVKPYLCYTAQICTLQHVSHDISRRK